MKYFCCDERRRSAVQAHGVLNGIDFIEVLGDRSDPFSEQQRFLAVHFLKDLAPGALSIENFRIDGGERIPKIVIVGVTSDVDSPPSSPPAGADVVIVEVQEPGDFSPYCLKILEDASDPESAPPLWLDPILSSVTFSFKVTCPTDLDCQPAETCSPEVPSDPDISYLAKDYTSFRQLMLDRLSVVMPGWTERHAADLGIALVELLAYVGDYLSYQQDAVATEAYLGTARRRVSVRRHARLVDYPIHDGSNARTWILFTVRPDIHGVALMPSFDNTPTQVLTRLAPFTDPQGMPRPVVRLDSTEYATALQARPEVFELLDRVLLDADHNHMPFYTWGARECCLAKGSTTATLRGRFPNLRKGDLLLFEELLGPNTGSADDADPAHRHVVRLTRVTPGSDPLGGRFEQMPSDAATDITEIEWHDDDALPFALTISARSGATYFDEVSVARGNVVPADHGRTGPAEMLGVVPELRPFLTPVTATTSRCQPQELPETPVRYRPRLARGPVTQAAPYSREFSAAAVEQWSHQECLPAVWLHSVGPTSGSWQSRRDLLKSSATSLEFVVEVESDSSATIRFGDDRFGSRPASGTTFTAVYRTGNGTSGNVGAESLVHVGSIDPVIASDLDDPVVVAVRNPLPGSGGTEPESMEQVRRNAPAAFRVQERAVTAADYAEMAQRCDPGIQRAAGTFRWTGSWRTTFVTADRKGGASVDSEFEAALRDCLERYRMAGHDLEVDGPIHVSLEIEMTVCVDPGYFASDVQQALRVEFNRGLRPDGTPALFHPDQFTFGQTIYASPWIAAAQSVPGVMSVELTMFRRQADPSVDGTDAGFLEMSRLEVARVDSDPSFPERGVCRLVMKGGR